MFLLVSACLLDLGERSVGAHAGRCADCHEAEAEAFAASRHADAASSPVFVALRDQAESELGAAAFCDGCHAPEGSIRCVTCHDVAGNTSTANGELVHDPTGPVRGPRGERGAPHASVASDFLTNSAMCGTCHEVTGVAGFEEHPFTAWEESPAAASGERCQDCHMDGHRFLGLAAAPEDLLLRGIELHGVPGGVALTNHAGHTLPDGASFSRELWLESREQGVWTGDRRPLHALLLREGEPTWNPVAADQTVQRGVPAGATRFEPFELEVCVRFRPLAEGLARGLDLPVPRAVTVLCVSPEQG